MYKIIDLQTMFLLKEACILNVFRTKKRDKSNEGRLVIDFFDLTVSAHGNSKSQKLINGGHDHNEYDYDPSYAYVLFKNR